MEKFDVVVIGTGSGSSVAYKCAKAGKKTAIVKEVLPCECG